MSDEFENPTAKLEEVEQSYDLFDFMFEIDGGTDEVRDYLAQPVKLPSNMELKISQETHVALVNSYKLFTLELADQALDNIDANDEAMLRRRAYRQGMQNAVLTILKRVTPQ